MAEETKVSKRNILHMLGIAPAGLAAMTIQPEDLTSLPGNGRDNPEVGVQNLTSNKYQPDKLARVLEKLAENVRAHRVSCSRFHIGTNAVGGDDFHGREKLIAPRDWSVQQIIVYQAWYDRQPPGSVKVLPHGMRVERHSNDYWLSQRLTIDLEMLVKDEPIDDKERPFANREGFYKCSGCGKEFTISDKKLVCQDMRAWHIQCVDVSTLPVKDVLGWRNPNNEKLAVLGPVKPPWYG